MVTIYRAHGLRIVIFTDDHEPAHVHVFGDGHAKINLAGPDGAPDLIWADGMKRNEARRAMQVVIERQAEFLARWRQIHG
jgi:histidinol phosphatase-like PHP family hydrolase